MAQEENRQVKNISWTPENREKLERFLRTGESSLRPSERTSGAPTVPGLWPGAGAAGSQRSPRASGASGYLGSVPGAVAGAASGGVAVFDLDNACIYNDVGEAMFNYMALNGLYDWDSVLSSERLWQHSNGREALTSIYKAGGGARLGFEFVRTFRAICKSAPKKISHCWPSQVLVGKTPEEVREITRRVMEREMNLDIGREVLSPGLGIDTGIRIYPEMSGLIEEMRRAGMEVWVVSATNRWSVEVFVGRHFGVPPERVIAMTPGIERGRVSDRMDESEFPITCGEGKVEAIRKFIGRVPAFVAGNSEPDWEMLCHASHLRLLIDCGDGDLLARVEERKRAGENWIVQPRFINPPENDREL